MKETEGSANDLIVVLPERLLARRREPRQPTDRGQRNSVGTATRLRAGQLRNRGSFPRKARFFLFSQVSRRAVGSTKTITERVRQPLCRLLSP